MRDADVRVALRRRLAQKHEGDSTTRIVEEMGVWSNTVRIDLAVINGELSGFELKSDRDTLARLPYQIEIYGKVFDRLTLVVGGKHIDRALGDIPPWWGCISATMKGSGVVLKEVRRGRINPSRDPMVLARMLWREEAIAALETLNLAAGWRSRRADEIAARLVDVLPFSALSATVRNALKAREQLGQSVGDQRKMPVQ